MAQEFMHKNKLQEYAQRCASALPIYHTVNEGSPHAPMFRSSVTVDGAIFTLPLSFSNKKAAEQNIAKYALDCIISNIKNNGVPLIHHDTVFCKSVLHEYAVKMNLKMPTYETSPQPGIIPIFVSSVTFDDKTFKGGFAKSKKEAEQIGARTVIEFILENSDTRTVMSQIIKSKGRLYDTMGKGMTASSSLVRSTITFVPNIADTSEKGTQMQVPSNCNVSPDVTSLRPFSAEPNTTVTDSITAEAMREQINKQTSDLISVNTLQTLPQVVGAGGSVNGVSGNDSAAFHIQHPVAAFHIQHPVEVKVEILSNDSGSPCGDSQNLVSGTSKKRSGKRKKSNSKMKKARVETKSQAE